MYGCDTTGYTVEGTAANNLVTGTGVDLFSSESTARSATSTYTSRTYPTYTTDDNTLQSSREGSKASVSSISESTTASPPNPTQSNAAKGGRLEDASNLATIVGTAVGIPMAVAAVAVAIYFGLKQNAKRKEDPNYTQIEMDEHNGARWKHRILKTAP
jgi:hypothetical protein